MIPDTFTNTEDQAAAYDRANATDDRETDHDDGVRRGPHCMGDCDDPTCADVIVWAAVRRDKERQRMQEWSA